MQYKSIEREKREKVEEREFRAPRYRIFWKCAKFQTETTKRPQREILFSLLSSQSQIESAQKHKRAKMRSQLLTFLAWIRVSL